MINVILGYNQTEVFNNTDQEEIDKVDFALIPEMRDKQKEVEVDGEGVIQKIKHYQANAEQESDVAYFIELLSKYGELEIIGKWVCPSGEIIELDINKYRDALRDIETFEDAVFIDGVDYTGREEEFELVQKTDEDSTLLVDDLGEPIFEQPIHNRFKRPLPKKRPTLSQAKKTQVNTFSVNTTREL